MWPVVASLVRRYVVPVVVFPVALVIGTIGYNLEGLVSDKHTPSKATSVKEDRDERMMRESSQDPASVQSLKESVKFTSSGVLSKNLSPSLTDRTGD